jgi:hypothetical protein
MLSKTDLPIFIVPKILLEFLLQVLLSLALILFSPFILLISLPIFLCRLVVKFSAPIFRSDLGKMLQTRGQLFAVDGMFTEPKCNILSSFVLEGDVDIEEVKAKLLGSVLERKTADGLKPRYPEFMQYLVKWGGYFFWKDDKEFKLERHIKVMDTGGDVTEEEMRAIGCTLLQNKWEEGHPLWECFMVKNYVGNGSELTGEFDTEMLALINNELLYELYSL